MCPWCNFTSIHSSSCWTGQTCKSSARPAPARRISVSWSTNAWTPRSDEPPPCTAARASAFHLAARSAIASASGPPMTSSTQPRSASLVSGAGARTPTRCTSTRNLALIRWSDHWGDATTGTPAASASAVEFHPQCVTKQPVAGCDSTRPCAHHGTTFPQSPQEQAAAARAEVESVARLSSRRTHRKGRPVAASPAAISATSSESILTRLPNATNTTERGACASSHSMQPPLSSSVVVVVVEAPLDTSSGGSRSGPIGTTGKSLFRSPSTAACSSSSNVFTNTHDTASRARPRSATSIWRHRSCSAT
ncbi:hypothetical protein QOZ80_1AG0028990 [Eleusine coracana subsp. coracana]|nr:hypothetical protein QOZ80_1AG0028990 [Eleusine coracana subsp. coracana]